MSEIKEIQIDRHDGNKYRSTATSGVDTFAKIHYKDDGSIDEELTYSKSYYAKLHPEEIEDEKDSTEDEDSSQSYSSSSYGSYSSSQTENSDNKGFFETTFGKIICTIIPILPAWWIIKCPFSWITYPLRKAVKWANNQGNNILPSYCFRENDGWITILLQTIILVLPLWWIIKLIGNLLTLLPRLLLNIWTVNNDNFWPRYSFFKF